MHTDPLIRFFEILQSSPAMFLADCGIWTYPGPEEIRLALADLVADQRKLLDRATIVLEEREQPRPRVEYPIAFTGWHDINLRHMLPRVIESLGRQRDALETLSGTPGDAATATFAADGVRSARRHIDVLTNVKTKLQSPGAVTAAP